MTITFKCMTKTNIQYMSIAILGSIVAFYYSGRATLILKVISLTIKLGKYDRYDQLDENQCKM